MLAYIRNNNIYKLINPEVPVTLVFASYFKTAFAFEYTKNKP